MNKGRLRKRELELAKIKLFVFDWSGVISDDRRLVYEANMRILREYGKPTMSFEEWLPRTRMVVVEFLANHGVFGDPEEFFALYKRYFDEAVKSGVTPTVYPEAKRVLESLFKKGRKIAVLSSHPEENVREEAEEYGLAQFFNLIVGDVKNKAEGLAKICKELGEDLKSTLCIGDTIYDIREAGKAGCWSAGVCSGYHSKERLMREKPDLLLDNLIDFRNILLENEKENL